MRQVTVDNIIARARIHADMKNSAFWTTEEALLMFNESSTELYDELVGAYENYFQKMVTIPIGSGVNFYDLPADFYKMLGVDFKVSNDAYITLKPFMEAERNVTLTTNVTIPNGFIRFRYVPAPPVYTAYSDTVDGVAGWDRLLSLLLAIDMLDSEESDTTALRAKYARTLQRIRDMAAPRDAGMPARVVDVHRPNIQLIYGALRYRLQGDQVEFINTEFLGSDLFPDIM